MAGELADRDGDQQASDQGEEDSKRQAATGIRSSHDDREGDGRGGGHMCDRLKKGRNETNGVSL
jgi:hypothetical protein